MRYLVVFAHVTQRVKADAAAHQAVDQGHDYGEFVHEQILRHLQMLALRQLEPNHQPRLGQRQRHDQRAFRTRTNVNDENAHPDLDKLHAQVDPIRIKSKPRQINRGWQGGQEHGAAADGQRHTGHQNFPRQVRQAQQHQAGGQRNQDQC